VALAPQILLNGWPPEPVDLASEQRFINRAAVPQMSPDAPLKWSCPSMRQWDDIRHF
jgi:hypothetical protein